MPILRLYGTAFRQTCNCNRIGYCVFWARASYRLPCSMLLVCFGGVFTYLSYHDLSFVYPAQNSFVKTQTNVDNQVCLCYNKDNTKDFKIFVKPYIGIITRILEQCNTFVRIFIFSIFCIIPILVFCERCVKYG